MLPFMLTFLQVFDWYMASVNMMYILSYGVSTSSFADIDSLSNMKELKYASSIMSSSVHKWIL